MDDGADMVLVRVPLREAREIFPDRFVIRMEKMRPIAVHEDAVLVMFVIAVAADRAPPLHDKHPPPRLRQPLGHDSPGHAGADDEGIKKHRNFSFHCKTLCPLFYVQSELLTRKIGIERFPALRFR